MSIAPYYWLDCDGAAYLRHHYSTFVIIRQVSARRCSVCIMWGEHTLYGKAGSIAQAKRHVERWVSKQTGIPGLGRRRRK
jgi:hypothetical protein